MEVAVVIPLLFLVILAAVQAATFYHARNSAQSAAAACAERMRGADSSGGAGRAAARSLLNQSGALTSFSVAASNGNNVTCTVTGSAPVIIDAGGMGTIRQTVSMPKDRVTRP